MRPAKGLRLWQNEIKELARQTSEATKVIKDRIESVQLSTSETVEEIAAVNEIIVSANEMTSTVAVAVDEQAATTEEISRNIRHASAGINEVTENISHISLAAAEIASGIAEIDEITGALDKSSRQVEQSAKALGAVSDELAQAVSTFEV